MKTQKIYLVLLICSLLVAGMSACASSPTPTSTSIPSNTNTPNNANSQITETSPVPKTGQTYGYSIVRRWPHNPAAFTQGLVFKNGNLYESNGQNGRSDLRILDLQTGIIKAKVDLSFEYFGEGMTILNGKIFQLTWNNNKGFIYDENTLAPLGEFTYEGEGWGLTNDGRSLIMSNGSNNIIFLNPETFQVQKIIQVYDNGAPLYRINELEYIQGNIYANIWHSDKIALIDPGLGEIVGWIDLTGLLPGAAEKNGEAVLNGIAYDSATDRLFVTGKLWPVLFEIKLVEQ